MITSWLFMLVTGACAMPKPLAAVWMADKPLAAHQAEHDAHANVVADDCSLKPCPDGQPTPSLSLKLDQPEIPLLLLGLTWLCSYWLDRRRKAIRLKPLDENNSQSVPLIYRFCILLN